MPSRRRRAAVAGGRRGRRRLRGGGGGARRTRRVAGSGRGRPGSIPDVSLRGSCCRRRRSLFGPVRRPPWAVSAGGRRQAKGREGGEGGFRGARDGQGAAARPPAPLAHAPWGGPSSRAARRPGGPFLPPPPGCWRPGRRGAPLRGRRPALACRPRVWLRGQPCAGFPSSGLEVPSGFFFSPSPLAVKGPTSWVWQISLGKGACSVVPGDRAAPPGGHSRAQPSQARVCLVRYRGRERRAVTLVVGHNALSQKNNYIVRVNCKQ